MNLYSAISLIFLSMLSHVVSAGEAYQYETAANLNTYESDFGYQSNDVAISMAYYFSSIDQKNYPRQEASFVARTSAVGASVLRGASKYFGSEADDSSVELEGLLASPSSPYVIMGSISQAKTKSISGFIDSTSTSVSLMPGYYLSEQLFLGASLSRDETKQGSAVASVRRSAGFHVKWLNLLPGGKAYNLVASIDQSNYESMSGSSMPLLRTAMFGGDYYFTNDFSVGAQVAVFMNDGESRNDAMYGLASTYFITPKIYVMLAGRKYDQVGSDAKSANAVLGMRF